MSVVNTKGVSAEEFEIIRKYVKETIKNICEDMLDGNISIAPYKNKDRIIRLVVPTKLPVTNIFSQNHRNSGKSPLI